MNVIQKPPEQLEREDLIRQTLDEAIRRIEQLDGNPIYQKAWKVAVAAVRALKV
jgi:hypothetical protein